MTVTELLEQARLLSLDEQRQLAHDLLIESDGPYEDESAVADAWAAEIAQRLSSILDGTAAGVPQTEVRARLVQ